MKILVTGGAGFIGKWVIESIPADTEIVIIDSLEPQVHKTSQDFAPELKARAICIKDDVQNIEAYRDAIEGTDTVIHLASQTGTGQSMYELSKYVQHNTNGTAKLLELISSLDRQPRRIILSSSRAIYGEGAYTDGKEVYYPKGRNLNDLKQGRWEIYSDRQGRSEADRDCKERTSRGEQLSVLPMGETQLPNPTSVYGLTKLWQEQLLQNYCESQNIDLAILRFQNVYGPKQELGNPYTGIIGIFTNAVVQGNTVELFEDGLMTRDFVFVKDLAEAVVKCAFYEKSLNKVINIGSGKAVTLLELVQTLAKLTKKEEKITVSGRFRVGDIRHAVADMNTFTSIFGKWTPTPLEKGLAQYLDWYLQQSPVDKTALELSLAEMEQKGLLISKHS